MRRILTFCIVTIIALCFSDFSAHAHDYGSANVGITVEITLGGTAAIIPDVQSPVPDKTELTLKDGEIGRFDIAFSSVGEYGYTVRNVPDDRDLKYDKTVYKIKIYVNDVDGKLEPTVIVYKCDYKYSGDPERLLFVNTDPGEVKPPPGPKTEDNSRTTAAFLFALLASAGTLAILAYLTGKHKRNNW